MTVRWIRPTLGTGPASTYVPAADRVLLDVRDLVDKRGNPVESVRRKIDEGVAHLRSGRTVVVGCDYGISRSNAIAAGVLSIAESIAYTEAVREVMSATGERDLKLEPLSVVLEAIRTAPAAQAAGTRVLMTGGSGLIGSAARQRLAGAGVAVFAPTRAELDLADGAALLDLFAKEHGATQIVHLANPRVYTSNRAIGETLVLLKNVIDVCVANGLHLTYASGWEIYAGYASADILASEALPPFPKGPYGEAKWLAESVIRHHREVSGLQCCILRSSPLYGIGASRPRFIYTFIEKALAGQTIHTHRYLNGPPKLDLMSVDDFTAALAAAVRLRPAIDLNLGTGILSATDAIAARIRDRLGSPSRVEPRPVHEFTACVAMDAALARRTLSWAPAVAIDEGLDRLIAHVTAASGARE